MLGPALGVIVDQQAALSSWQEEKNSSFLYYYVAAAEKGTPRETLFLNLATAAEGQAQFWATELTKLGFEVPLYQPDLRTKWVVWLIKHFKIHTLKPILAAMKIRGLSVYLGEIPGHVAPVADGKLEKQHQIIQSGVTIRAAVFGINDGLVSNASLILGMVGASSSPSLIILSGLAGLSAGALSMAAGEYISMRSQRELFEYQIALERAELEEYPEEEAQELSFIYQARGMSKPHADTFAHKMLLNKEHALNTLAREELGLNPEELGSPWKAAISSFLAFAIGGLIPLFPFLFNFSEEKVFFSVALTGIALFLIGAILSLFTGRSAVYSGFRMLFIGAIAGATTFVIGHLVGVAL